MATARVWLSESVCQRRAKGITRTTESAHRRPNRIFNLGFATYPSHKITTVVSTEFWFRNFQHLPQRTKSVVTDTIVPEELEEYSWCGGAEQRFVKMGLKRSARLPGQLHGGFSLAGHRMTGRYGVKVNQRWEPAIYV
jgi:hypothetical protein